MSSKKFTQIWSYFHLVLTLISNFKSKWKITSDFCGLLTKPELYNLTSYQKRIAIQTSLMQPNFPQKPKYSKFTDFSNTFRFLNLLLRKVADRFIMLGKKSSNDEV